VDSHHVSYTLKQGETLRGLACGREHSHLVVGNPQDTVDTIYSLGNNMYGQLGTGESKSTRPGELMATQQPAAIHGYEGERIVDIVCGMDNTVFATGKEENKVIFREIIAMANFWGGEEDRNKMYAMGWGADGQLGQGHDQSDDQSVPSYLPLEGPLQKLSSSTDFTLALLGK
jgi:alpha-tubulin suppressor-like RCC1 family protein